MFYLENADGNVVRAIQWSGDQLIFVLRHDTRRVESCEDLAYFDSREIEYTVLDKVSRKSFAKSSSYQVRNIGGHLRLVQDSQNILANVELPSDDPKKFNEMLKKTTLAGIGLALLFAIIGFFAGKKAIDPKEEIQVVQVMDRKQIEKMVVLPPAPQKQIKAVVPRQVVRQKTVIPKPHKKVVVNRQMGVLGVLGSLKNSKQHGGLNLNAAQTTAGIGQGGTQGSGGVQTAVYSKGLFAAPLGSGGNINGAGGYGTRGKGGGQAGYGKVSLVGSGNSYFQPVESEAWVEGGLDRNEISAVIQRHLSEVRFCYEQGLQQKPRLSGRMSMKFMIGPSGSVTLAQVMNSSLNHAVVENCVRDRLKTWKFPQPQGGVTVKVTYPFILRRVSDT